LVLPSTRGAYRTSARSRPTHQGGFAALWESNNPRPRHLFRKAATRKARTKPSPSSSASTSRQHETTSGQRGGLPCAASLSLSQTARRKPTGAKDVPSIRGGGESGVGRIKRRSALALSASTQNRLSSCDEIPRVVRLPKRDFARREQPAACVISPLPTINQRRGSGEPRSEAHPQAAALSLQGRERSRGSALVSVSVLPPAASTSITRAARKAFARFVKAASASATARSSTMLPRRTPRRCSPKPETMLRGRVRPLHWHPFRLAAFDLAPASLQDPECQRAGHVSSRSRSARS
jgi:hypothetical protein